jgi:hypothetical protein
MPAGTGDFELFVSTEDVGWVVGQHVIVNSRRISCDSRTCGGVP